jgi:hypothetical protein
MVEMHCRCLVTVGFTIFLMEIVRLCLAVGKIEALIVLSLQKINSIKQ